MPEKGNFVPVATEVGEGILKINTPNSLWGDTKSPNIYLVTGLEYSVFIDAGEGYNREEKELVAGTWSSVGKPVKAVVATHHHADHVGGIPSLKKFAREARVVGGKGGRISAKSIDLGGRTLKVFPTPGHTVDSICVIDSVSGGMFTGDTILGRDSTIVENMGAYSRSLEAIEEANPEVLFPGHGTIDDAGEKIRAYRQRTLDREKQVLDLINQGVDTVPDIATARYGIAFSTERRQIESHVKKLIADGKLSRARGSGRLILSENLG